MKEITSEILSALAKTADCEVEGLPLAEDLYTDTAVAGTVAAFVEFCDVSVGPPPRRMLMLRVRPEYRERSRQVIGEFLNYLLGLALREHSVAS